MSTALEEINIHPRDKDVAGLGNPSNPADTNEKSAVEEGASNKTNNQGPNLSSTRKRKQQQMQQDFNVPPHSERLTAMNIRAGLAPSSATWKTVRKLNGFSNRSEAWTEHLFPKGETEVGEDRTRYLNKLQVMFDRCEACARLRCDHLSILGASFLPGNNADERAWEESVFTVHAVTKTEEKDAIKRLLLVLEEDYDFDCAPLMIDLVCILSLYLSEVQVYAACRRFISANSFNFKPISRTRTTLGSRKLLPLTYSSQQSLHLLFLKCVDPSLSPFLPPKEEIQTWFERFLIPLLPMNRVVALIDCLIAGDDWKVLLRECLLAVNASRRLLLENKQHSTTTTVMIREHIKTIGIDKMRAMGKRRILGEIIKRDPVPSRSILTRMETEITKRNATGRPTRERRKEPVGHVPTAVFRNSTTILTFEAASRLVKFIPSQYRHASLRMRSIYQSEIGPMADQTLQNLYQACGKEKNCSFLVVIAAKVPKGEGNLIEKEYDPRMRTDSTSFSHPLVKDANYVVFGFFSPAPLVPSVSSIAAFNAIASNQTAGDENACVFRVAPGYASKHWEKSKLAMETNSSSLVTCLPTSILVGKSSTSASSAPPPPPPTIGKEEAKEEEKQTEQQQLVHGPALYLDHRLEHGFTGYSEVFENDPLCGVDGEPKDYTANPMAKSEQYYFNIFAVEVFALPRV